MGRKKHTHLSKSETVAEVEAGVSPLENGEQHDGHESDAAEPLAAGRLRRLVLTAEEVAKKRLQGTRAERLLDNLPERLEKQLDAVLDRLGLVRKSRLEAEGHPFSPANTEQEATNLGEPHLA